MEADDHTRQPAPPSSDWRLLALEEYVTAQADQLRQLMDAMGRLEAHLAAPSAPPPHAAAAAAPPTPTSPRLDVPTPAPIPKTSAVSRNIRPAAPPAFNGDRKKGRAFWSAVSVYMSICGAEFPSEAAKIQWVLSYMNSERAYTYAERIMRLFDSGVEPFTSWEDFRAHFTKEFFPLTEKEDAINMLFSKRYFQGTRSVDEYVDAFNEIIYQAGHTDGLAITSYFRQGLNASIQNKVATMQDRPDVDNFDGWCQAARKFDQDRQTNLAFNAAQAPTPSAVPSRFRPAQSTFAPPPIYRPPPGPPPSIPVVPAAVPVATPPRPVIPRDPNAMDVDAARLKAKGAPLRCFRCGRTGHVSCDCPFSAQIHAMQAEDLDAEIECLLAAKDAMVAEQRSEVNHESEEAVVENFQSDRE